MKQLSIAALNLPAFALEASAKLHGFARSRN
jgi:hypothetical protein